MLPADTIAEITTNLAALDLQPNTAAQILAAVLAPLLRNSGPDVDPDLLKIRKKRAGRPRGRPRRRTSQRRRKARARRRAGRSTDARERAIAALKANPGASLTAVAKIAGVSRSTVVNAARELAAEARKQARKSYW